MTLPAQDLGWNVELITRKISVFYFTQHTICMAWFFSCIYNYSLKFKKMKTLMKLKFAWFTLVLSLLNIAAYAQDKKVDLDVNIGKENGSQWYSNPIVWVVGGAVFILLLVALLRGKSSN